MMKLSYSLILLSFLFISCNPVDTELVNHTRIGLKPVYATDLEWQDIKVTDARIISKLGKIYYKDGFIFVNESGEGIHIIDNADPANPVFLKFIEIIGNRDIAIKGNILYADNLTDLVTLDISNFDDIKVLNRVKNIYPERILTFPQNYTGFFECVDPNLGTVIRWEETSLTNPKCWR